jgi:hypothetical protein
MRALVSYKHVAVGVAFFALCLAATTQARAQSIVLNEKVKGVEDRGIVVPASELNRERFEQLAKEFLKKEGQQPILQRLIVAPDKEALLANYVHGTPQDSPESTFLEIQQMGLPNGPLGRLLAVNGRAKLSYLDRDGLTARILDGGSDPTVFREGGIAYELLHFNASKARVGTTIHPYSLEIFLRASPRVSLASCVAITKRFQLLLNFDNLSVEIRADDWFPESQDYPAVLAFSKSAALPDPGRYVRQPAVTCGAALGKLRCSGSNFEP